MAQEQTEAKKLSKFTFGSTDTFSNASAQISTSPRNDQLKSPIHSPVSETVGPSIFERSVQDSVGFDSASVPKCNRCSSNRSRSCTHNSSISLQSGQFLKNEDYIPPALDATTSILNDKETNLDDVEMIYPNRRNSSVLGLNMALGRSSHAPSRKNSVYSTNSFQHSVPVSSQGSNQPSQVQSPVSPPKLVSSKSSLSFYSYADMINNDEYARRPSFQQSFSQGVVPTKNYTKPNSSNFGKSNSTKLKNPNTSSQLSKQLSLKDKSKSNLNKFLISPESSDSEENDFVSVKSGAKSITSTGSFNDNESLVSSSVGDCIRRTTTELYGS